MHLIVGLVVFCCLFFSEVGTPSPIPDVLTRIAAMIVAMCCVPAMAVFQTIVFNRTTADASVPRSTQHASLRRISWYHTIIWMLAILFIFAAVKWQNIVRGNWELDRWPLLDEIVILAPVVLSLVASWAVFYEIQKGLSGELGSTKQRLQYISVRFRVFFAITLIPLLGFVLLKDVFWFDLDALSLPTSLGLAFVLLISVLAIFPFLLQFAWKNRPIENPSLRSELLEICDDEKLALYDIRIWDTGRQIINAVVSGVFPHMRILMLSDALIRRFPRHELKAIVRHEAGHIRLGHLPIRIGFVLLPLVLIAAVENSHMNFGLADNAKHISYAFAYLGFIALNSIWLSRKMEFEADLYAVGLVHPEKSHPGTSQNSNTSIARAQAMADALLRFGAYMPEQLERRSITHPSLWDRITFIRESSQNSRLAVQFRRRFAMQRLIITALILVPTAFFLAF